MKKARMILLIASVIMILVGTIGVIVVSNRELDRELVDMNNGYVDMWRRVVWASEGTWTITEEDRKEWPTIDRMVAEASANPELKEKIRNEYLPDSEKDLDQAWDEYHQESSAKRTGIDNGCWIIFIGAVLFLAWLAWTRLEVRKGRKAVAA